MRLVTYYVFCLTIFFSAVCVSVYSNLYYSSYQDVAKSLIKIFYPTNDKLYLTEDGILWLNEFKKCVSNGKIRTLYNDLAKRETLELAISTMVDLPTNLIDVKRQADTVQLIFKVNLSNPINIEVWLVEDAGEMYLHKMDGMCSLVSCIRQSRSLCIKQSQKMH